MLNRLPLLRNTCKSSSTGSGRSLTTTLANLPLAITTFTPVYLAPTTSLWTAPLYITRWTRLVTLSLTPVLHLTLIMPPNRLTASRQLTIPIPLLPTPVMPVPPLRKRAELEPIKLFMTKTTNVVLIITRRRTFSSSTPLKIVTPQPRPPPATRPPGPAKTLTP